MFKANEEEVVPGEGAFAVFVLVKFTWYHELTIVIKSTISLFNMYYMCADSKIAYPTKFMEKHKFLWLIFPNKEI